MGGGRVARQKLVRMIAHPHKQPAIIIGLFKALMEALPVPPVRAGCPEVNSVLII